MTIILRTDSYKVIHHKQYPDKTETIYSRAGQRSISDSVAHRLTGGAAHLANFMGNDTVTEYFCARQHYDEPMACFSIPVRKNFLCAFFCKYSSRIASFTQAAEHSTITSWTKIGESTAFKNMFTQFLKDMVFVLTLHGLSDTQSTSVFSR